MKGVVHQMLALDHIVIPAHDPKVSAHKFAVKNHVRITKGGEHPLWGTYNYLAYFQNDTYIEWIGVNDYAIAEKSTNPLIQQVVQALKDNCEKPIQYALRTSEMKSYIQHLDAISFAYSGPVSGSRGRPAGSLLEWKMLFPICPTTQPLPFLIEWGDVPNVPTDTSYINKQSIFLLTDQRENIGSYKTVFHVPVNNDSKDIILENCQIQLGHGNHLSFTLK